MKPDFQKPLALLSFILAIGLGLMTWKADRLESRIALLKGEHQAAIDATEIAGNDRLIKSLERQVELSRTLREAEAALKEAKERKQHEIVKFATNRPCFNAELVRVLNDTDARSDAAGMSQAIPSIDAEDGAFATDTDVALWIENAKEQYEVCRARYHALIDFNPPKPISPLKND